MFYVAFDGRVSLYKTLSNVYDVMWCDRIFDDGKKSDSNNQWCICVTWLTSGRRNFNEKKGEESSTCTHAAGTWPTDVQRQARKRRNEWITTNLFLRETYSSFVLFLLSGALLVVVTRSLYFIIRIFVRRSIDRLWHIHRMQGLFLSLFVLIDMDWIFIDISEWTTTRMSILLRMRRVLLLLPFFLFERT